MTSQPIIVREPARNIAKNCPELIADFILSPEYSSDFKTVLREKKLITMKEKMMQLEYPHLAWINRVKKSFNISLKNWNYKRYPAFYLSHDDEVVPIAKSYSQALEKELNNEVDEQATQTLTMVRAWQSSYENYNKELNDLIEERVALQYNYTLLKKLDLQNETRDIQLSFKKDGLVSTEVFSLHPEDNTYKSLLGDLKNRMNELDGGLIRDGKIKERIVKQAMLQDTLTIVQRELEHDIKNSDQVSTDLLRELSHLNNVMSNSDFSPSTYGIFKITNKVFISELLSLSKLDIAYKKFQKPLDKLETIFMNFSDGNKKNKKEKLGIFARVYARISHITPAQLATGTAVTATAGIGTYRYFWFNPATGSATGQPSNDPHQVQLDQTAKEINSQNDSNSQIIEVQIDEVLK
jgi:hypothetical protein